MNPNRFFSLLVLSLLLVPFPVLGEEPPAGDSVAPPFPRAPVGIFSVNYLKEGFNDAIYLAVSPARWERPQWMAFLGVAAGTGGLFFIDSRIEEDLQAHRRTFTHDFAQTIQGFGAQYAFATLGLFYVGGVALNDGRAYGVAADGLEASLLAGGITEAFKISIGRDRPFDLHGSRNFLPFRLSNLNGTHNSFPSGHATEAFAVASVIATRYDSLWIQSGAYGLAGLVGLARLEENVHFASDVFAGAAIGTWVGRTLVLRHLRESGGESSLIILPLASPAGLLVQLKF